MSTRDRGRGICDVGDALRSFPYSPACVSGQDEIPPCPSEGLEQWNKKGRNTAGNASSLPRCSRVLVWGLSKFFGYRGSLEEPGLWLMGIMG